MFAKKPNVFVWKLLVTKLNLIEQLIPIERLKLQMPMTKQEISFDQIANMQTYVKLNKCQIRILIFNWIN